MYVHIWGTGTFLHGGFKTKEVVHFKTTNHCTGLRKDVTREREKGNYVRHQGSCLTCLLVNSLRPHVVAGT